MKTIDNFEFIHNHLEEIHTTATQKGFLGREFLTWLWFFADATPGSFEFECEPGKKVEVQVGVDDRLVLTAKVGQSHEHIIKGGTPSRCDEALMALSHGKSVKEMRVSLDIGQYGMFSLTLSGDDLNPKGVRLPDHRDDIEASPLEQRIQQTSLLGRVLDQLMVNFMTVRASQQWENDHLKNIRSWIQTRAQLRENIIH